MKARALTVFCIAMSVTVVALMIASIWTASLDTSSALALTAFVAGAVAILAALAGAQ